MRLRRVTATALSVVSLAAVLVGTTTASADENGIDSRIVWARSNERPEPLKLGASYAEEFAEQKKHTGGLREVSSSTNTEGPASSSEANEQKIARDNGDTYVAEPGRAAASQRQEAAAAMTPEKCRTTPGAHDEAGKVVNHFSYCRWGYNIVTKLDGNGRIEGQVRFRETEVGTGSAGLRDATIEVWVDEVLAIGKFTPAAVMQLKVWGKGAPTDDSCKVTEIVSNPYKDTLARWQNSYIAYGLESSVGSGAGPDDNATCVWRHDWQVTGGGIATPWSNGPTGGVRFDSSKSFGSQHADKGAIFNRVVPSFHYDRADNSVKGVANHIYDSLHAPETTFPKKEGKVIPGWVWGDTFRPLHRNWSKFDAAADELARKHKAERTRACNQLTRPGPTYQCDEFPFASTMEGAGVGDGNFSVRYVPGTENEQAGRDLADWYGSDRILHQNPYGIYVD